MATGERPDPADFRPTASWHHLQARARLLAKLRRFFAVRDFVEVETPLLSAETVVDRYLDPLPVTLFSDPSAPHVGPTYWLQTSPEFAMKRMLAAGAQRIFQVTRALRAGERGPWHNPEFTLVEWYRVGDTLPEGQQLLADLAVEMLAVDSVERMTYAEAFQQYAGIDPFESTVEELAQAATRRGAATRRDPLLDDRDSWLNFLLATAVQPRLGQDRPLILDQYPATQAALATLVEGDPRVANRFELYFRGVELANGYHELVDPDELRRRIQVANRHRAEAGKYLLPEQSRLLDAMDAGLPPSVGVALGFDRLAMLALNLSHISQIIPFPIDRA